MNTNTTLNYYMDRNGRISCADHMGGYAQTELKRNPNLKRICTPITTWNRLSYREVVEFTAEFNGEDPCESCHFSK